MGIGISNYSNLMDQVALKNLDLDTTYVVVNKDKGNGGEVGLVTRSVREAEPTDEDIRTNVLARSQLLNSLSGDKSLSAETMTKVRNMLFGELGDNGQYSLAEAQKPLTARTVISVMTLVNGGVSQIGRGVIDLLRNDRMMDEDVEGRLDEIVSALKDADVEGAAGLVNSVGAVKSFYASFLKSTATEVLHDANFEEQAAKYLDLAEGLREIANSHEVDAEARNAIYALCEKLSVRGGRLLQIRDDLSLRQGDAKLMKQTMKSLVKSGIAKGPKGDEVLKTVYLSMKKFADITRGVDSFLKSLDDPNLPKDDPKRFKTEMAKIAECAKELGEIRKGVAKAFGRQKPAVLSKSGKYLALLDALKSRLEAVGAALKNGGDTTELLKSFAPGTMLRGLLSGKLDINAYLEARHSGIEHGMIDTRYAGGNLRKRDAERLGAGHENTVYKGKFADKTTGDEGTLALKDRDHANEQVYGEIRLDFLASKKQDSLKANFYCSQAATALGIKGRVPDIHGTLQKEGNDVKVKIGMNVVRGQALGDSGTNKRVHERLTCEIVQPGNVQSTMKKLDEIKGKMRNDIRGDLMGEMNELDWNDMLTGEQGRHERNFMFDITEKGAHVYGIDNDKSFLKGCVGYGKYRMKAKDVWRTLGGRNLTPIYPPFMFDKRSFLEFGIGCHFEPGDNLTYLDDNQILARILQTLDPENFRGTDSVSLDSDRMVNIDFSRLKNKGSTFEPFFRRLTHVSSMRKPSFITQSMLNKLLAMEGKDAAKRKEYLSSLEGIGEEELEAAEFRLDDTIRMAKELQAKGRVIDDISQGNDGMLFRRVDVQRKVDKWHMEDRIEYMSQTLAELKDLSPKLLAAYDKVLKSCSNQVARENATANLEKSHDVCIKVPDVITTFNSKLAEYKKDVDKEGPVTEAVKDFKAYCNDLRKQIVPLFSDGYLLSSFDAFFNGFDIDESVVN